MASPILTLPALIVTTAILAALYMWSYGNLLPQNLPPPAVQLLTLGFYAVFALMLWALGPSSPHSTPAAASFTSTGWIFLAIFAVALAMQPVRLFAPVLAQIIVAIAFLAMIPAGVALFLLLPVGRLVSRLRRQPQ